MGRMEDRINRRMDERFDKIETRLESMQHEINACKLERDLIGLLIKKIDQPEKWIEELEKKTA